MRSSQERVFLASIPHFADDHLPDLAPWLGALVLWAGLMHQLARAPQELPLAMLVGGVLLLVGGASRRLLGFLHAKTRLVHLPLPLAADAHWRDAIVHYSLHLARSGLAGALALTGAWAFGQHDDAAQTIQALNVAGLVWAALLVHCACAEPFAAALAALLGRRVGAESAAREWQSWLSGGWTLPEAAVHLYTPAIGLALACAATLPIEVAMSSERVLASLAGERRLVLLAPVIVLLTLRLSARWIYRRGIFVATPTLHEVLRMLSGHASPIRPPQWTRWIAHPFYRVVLIQVWRLVPACTLRLAALALVTIWLAARPVVTPSALALALLCALLWWTPVIRLRLAFSRLLRHHSALPLALPRTSTIVAALALGPSLPLLVVLGMRLHESGTPAADALPETASSLDEPEYGL